MAQEWGQSIDVISVTEYKASLAEQQANQILQLKKQVQLMQSHMDKLKVDNVI